VACVSVASPSARGAGRARGRLGKSMARGRIGASSAPSPAPRHNRPSLYPELSPGSTPARNSGSASQ
jgi:hypothetical protein